MEQIKACKPTSKTPSDCHEVVEVQPSTVWLWRDDLRAEQYA